MEESNERPYTKIMVFIITILVDVGIILYSTINKISIILYIMVGIGLIGAYLHFYILNKDERLDTASNEASRLVVQIFYILLSCTGVLMIIISSFIESVLWEVGAALVISALVLIYLQGVIALIYADKMS
ncbi:MAG: DUF2178 domain-containing protein [Candidatus Heimdallarchaeota archaeon]|nr:DUF2178 domain-containing protein [Candidatus Heimdallarchaeota archaeon]MCK5048211.1 DUF2178 domain-containing protein [Candidatus Heimdallarchaeota archaeon]